MSNRDSDLAVGGVAEPADDDDLTVEALLTPEAREALAKAGAAAACPVCGTVEPHRHCTNCYDMLDVNDKQGHMMSSGMFGCSPKNPEEVRGAV